MEINRPEILFEDEHIIIVIKPVGILSQIDDSGDENMCTVLTQYLSTKEKAPYVGVIHRIDRGVGGVMVYAKTKFAAGKLSAQVADKDLFEKTYLAVIHGKPSEFSGELHDLLFKDTHLGKSFVVERERRGVKKASLSYELCAHDEKNDLSLVKIRLHTGRTHQIRVQFSSRRMPLAGDKKYGARDDFKNIGLWSASLAFLHPVTGKQLEFGAFPDYSASPWDIFSDIFIKPAEI